MSAQARTRLISILFAGAIVIATAPAWRLAVFGFNPALDDLLTTICIGQPTQGARNGALIFR